jgi:cell division protein FtsW (lipid II flippase)
VLVLDPDVLVVVIVVVLVVVVLVVVVLVVVVLVVGVVVVATLSVVLVADPDPVVAGWVVVRSWRRWRRPSRSRAPEWPSTGSIREMRRGSWLGPG